MTLAGTFLVYVGAVAATLCAVFLWWLPRPAAVVAIIALAVWLSYAGALGALGIVGNTSLRPPGIAILLIPIVLFIVVVIVRSPVGLFIASRVPLWLLVGIQIFRVGVEAFIQGLHDAGLLPRLMTFEGGNLELAVATSAPLVALISTRGVNGRRVALGWSVLGIASLLNIATRAVLTAPGALNLIHADVPNLAMGVFPFTFIPGFLAPLAVTLHILAIRSIRTTASVMD